MNGFRREKMLFAFRIVCMVSAGTNRAVLTSRKPWTCPIQMLFSLWTAKRWKLSSASLCFDGAIMTATGQGTKQLVAGLQWMMDWAWLCQWRMWILPVVADCIVWSSMLMTVVTVVHFVMLGFTHIQWVFTAIRHASSTDRINWIRVDKTLWM